MNNELLSREYGNYINGDWLQGKGESLCATNPANGQCYWQGQEANEQDVKEASLAAIASLPSWQKVLFKERVAICERFSEALDEKKEHLAQIISLETGKPFWEAITEVTAASNKLKISIKAYQERTGQQQTELTGFKGVLTHKPLGVVAVLGPYNFPLHLPNGHIIPALLAGNVVLFKASEQTPLTAIEMCKLWHKAGLPKGVFNLVQGGGRIGQALLNENIDAVLFTGSADTGLKLHRQFAGRPEVLLALEMGGNNPLIVWDVDTLDGAVYNTIQSAFISSGQRCTCARRLIVPKDEKGDDFLKALIEKVSNLSVGDYREKPEPFMGPVINQTTQQNLLEFQEHCLARGGIALLKMGVPREQGAFLSPGIIDMSETSIEDREIFGPLLQVIRVEDFNSAILEANNTRFGLSAGLLSDNQSLHETFYQEIKAGIVNFNRPLTGAASNAPFGGTGLSGNHRPSAYYAADFCAYPVASLEASCLNMPETLSPGLNW